MSEAADGFTEAFHVERPRSAIWRMLTEGHVDGRGRLPGFPDVDGGPGCAVEVEASDPQRLLSARKINHPCAGTRIDVAIGPASAADWPMRVSVSQRGFDVLFGDGGFGELRDTFEAHWRQIVADFRLYLERGVHAPRTVWPADLGAVPRQTPTGLELASVAAAGFAAGCGMQPGDLLLSLGGVRIHDIQQLWSVLALVELGPGTQASWVRSGDVHRAPAGADGAAAGEQ